MLLAEGLRWSTLHAASAAAAIYRRLGWQAVPMPCVVVTLNAMAATALEFVLDPHDVRELDWADWASVSTRLDPLNAATMNTTVSGAHVRSPAYWATWVKCPAEALDQDGEATAGVLRGWECAAVETSTTVGGGPPRAYALFKRAGSFSSNAECEVGADNPEIAAKSVPGLTLVDFGWARELDEALGDGEAWLLRLAHAAAVGFFGQAAASSGVQLTLPVALAPEVANSGLIAPQGEWMYCDLHAAAGGQPTDLTAVVNHTNHLVVPIDEF
eukprot:SAG31_NODE_2752_length_5141_cov_53.282031_1_plen_271_part_00